MSRYRIDYKFNNNKVNYSIIGHHEQKKAEVKEIFDEVITKRGLAYSKKNKNLLVNDKAEVVGFYELYKMD